MTSIREEKEFNMTTEEVNKLEECMKKKEFRDLLVEYAKEISDPENKKKYEEEITRMEQNRGRDVKFVDPEDGFVVKTTRKNDGLKTFVNVCYNQHIEKATAENSERNENGKRRVGQQWHIPYSLSHAREDLDNAGKKCIVYDAVFHPDTYKKGTQDARFKKLLVDTALDGIERQHKVKLDKKNLKFPKLKFKGMKQATVIRTESAQEVKSHVPPDQDLGGVKFPYPYDDGPTPLHKHKEEKEKVEKKQSKKEKKTASNEPVYGIIHRGHIDFQNFTSARDSNVNVTRPKELVVHIELPLKHSAAGLDLDIFEKQLLLDCKNPPYHLDVNLPYPVDEENGSAKFDKSKKQLVVTLPVLPPTQTESSFRKDSESSVESTESQTGSEQTSGLQHRSHESNSPQCFAQEAANGQTVIGSVSSNEASIQSNGEKTTHSASLGDGICGAGQSVTTQPTLTNDGKGDGGQLVDSQATTIVDGIKNIEESVTTQSTSTYDGIAGAGQSVATTNNFSSNTNVPGHNRDNGPEFGDDEFDDMPELVPMEQEAPQINSPPPVLGDVEQVQFVVPTTLKEYSSPLFFNCPPYTYHQDKQTVTFIVNVPNLSLEDISLGFNDNKCYISFPSVANDTPNQLPGADYALYISFPEGCILDTELCHIDVNKHNVVLLLQKSGSSQGLWECFKAGAGEEKLEEKYFITEKSVETMLKEIAEQDPWETGPLTGETNIQVTSVTDENITIQLESCASENTPSDSVQRNQRVSGKTSSSHSTTDLPVKENAQETSTSADQQLNQKEDGEMIAKCYQVLQNNIEDLASKTRNWSLRSDGEAEADNVLSGSDQIQEECSDKTQAVVSPKETKHVSFDPTAIENAKKIRKSCLRRSSSTCSEESVGDCSSDTSGTEGYGPLSESPRKNVRFNFNPDVRVFSNKKDKKRRKMEEKLRKEKEAAEKAAQATTDAATEATNGVETEVNCEKKTIDIDTVKEINGENYSLEDEVSSRKQQPVLTNSLIFDLDD